MQKRNSSWFFALRMLDVNKHIRARVANDVIKVSNAGTKNPKTMRAQGFCMRFINHNSNIIDFLLSTKMTTATATATATASNDDGRRRVHTANGNICIRWR